MIDVAALPEKVRDHPLLEESAWLQLRDSGIEPIDSTEMATTLQSRAEFLTGAWLLNKTWTPDGKGLLANIKPQMLRVVDMLTAGRFKNAIILPRRSSKTTTLWCVLLGRCFLREDHQAGYTMLTTQKKTAERYRLDVYAPIVKQWPQEDTRPVKVYKGNGKEHVEFPGTDSWLGILSPDGDAFRSGAYDTLVADEGGSCSPEMADDVKSAVLPAFDTRPGGQFIVAGTAAKYRDGNPLWERLNDPKSGKVRFTVADAVDPEELEAWEPDDEHPNARVRELIESMHPGVDSGLTTLEKIEDNYVEFSRDQFAEEYLGLFGLEGSNAGLISVAQWTAGLLQEAMPSVPPKHFALVIAVHPDRVWACIAAVWKRANGHFIGGLLHHQSGVKGFGQRALQFSRKYKVPIVYDEGSTAAAVEVEALLRTASPRPKVSKMQTSDVRRGATKLLKHLDEGTFHHYGQTELDQAAEIAVKRAIGTFGGFGFGRPKDQPNADIVGIEAVSLGVHAMDDEKPKGNASISTFAA